MRRKWLIFICILSMTAGSILPGCDSTSADNTEDPTGEAADEEAEQPKDAYDEYIKNAIASVDGSASSTDSSNEQIEGSAAPFEGKTIQVDRTAPNNLYVSAMDGPDTNNNPDIRAAGNETPSSSSQLPSPDPLSSSSSSSDSSAGTSGSSGSTSTTGEPTPTPYITPEEFEVGKCCIYINGESDSAFGTEVVTAINKTREDLGYKPFVKNKGLSTCADRRTRELAASYSHTRPNGQPFYSVAPEHFKAEMLIVGTQKAEDAVDTLIKTDPVSRNLIFTEKYQSIGASSFKCNGMQCTVVAFGL